jgi:hypothetical protein
VEIVLRLSVACELSNAYKSHFKTKFKSNTGGERECGATQDGGDRAAFAKLSFAFELSNANKSHFNSNTGGERDCSATQDGPQLD